MKLLLRKESLWRSFRRTWKAGGLSGKPLPVFLRLLLLFLLQNVFSSLFSCNLCDRYQDKEGWAPASYLKKLKDDLSPRKKTVTGPVEIIGNIMEISNLLNKKALSEKDVQTEGAPESPQVARKEISLPIACAESSPVNTQQDGKSKAEPASPAIARIAPHRVEIGLSFHCMHVWSYADRLACPN